MGKFIFLLIYGLYVDNTGLFTTGSFIVLVHKQNRKNKKYDGVPGRYVKPVFCLVFQFKRE